MVKYLILYYVWRAYNYVTLQELMEFKLDLK